MRLHASQPMNNALLGRVSRRRKTETFKCAYSFSESYGEPVTIDYGSPAYQFVKLCCFPESRLVGGLRVRDKDSFGVLGLALG